jgi:nitroreductase
MIKDLIIQNRSFRRFDAKATLDEQTLRELVELARLSGSAANLQPLKFVLSWETDRNALIFEHLQWAGYLQDWPGPALQERPTGYIIVLGDNRISKNVDCDHGIACQSILLGAAERGLGGCMIGSVDRKALSKKLGLSAELRILLVIALGKPTEEVVLEDVGDEGSIKYWRDEKDIHHVPKRKLDELIVEC